MDDGDNPAMAVLGFVILILLNCVVFGFMAAMQNISEASIEKQAKENDRRASLLIRYMDNTDLYMQVCQLILVISHMLFGIWQIPLWREICFSKNGISLYPALETALVFLVLMIPVLSLGVYTPQKIAARKPEIWVLRLAVPMRTAELLCTPLIVCMNLFSNLAARLFGVDPHSDTDDLTEEEIISMVKEGHEQGVLLASEAEMIHNIFEFGDKEAKDIMTHRKNIVAIDGTSLFLDTITFIKENNYSRFPVYEDDIDNIIGVLHIKEALTLSLEQSVFKKPVKDIDGLVREVNFIPETRNINSLFTEMQAQKSHMVIVVDEYGQTAGIVAMEDILEEIVGNIEDEHDEEEILMELLSDGSYRIHGMADFADVVELLSVKIEEEEHSEFETLNGFLIARLGRIPSEGKAYCVEEFGYLFQIESVENKMIASVHVAKLPEKKIVSPCQKQETMVE